MSGQGTGDRLGQHLALCREVAARGTPLTPEEEAVFRSQCAAEMARAEARRNPPRERDLLDQDQAA